MSKLHKRLQAFSWPCNCDMDEVSQGVLVAFAMKSLSTVNHRGAASEGSHIRAKGAATNRARNVFPSSRPATHQRAEACQRQMTLLASASKPGAGADRKIRSGPCLGRRAALFSVPLIGVEQCASTPSAITSCFSKFPCAIIHALSMQAAQQEPPLCRLRTSCCWRHSSCRRGPVQALDRDFPHGPDREVCPAMEAAKDHLLPGMDGGFVAGQAAPAAQ